MQEIFNQLQFRAFEYEEDAESVTDMHCCAETLEGSWFDKTETCKMHAKIVARVPGSSWAVAYNTVIFAHADLVTQLTVFFTLPGVGSFDFLFQRSSVQGSVRQDNCFRLTSFYKIPIESDDPDLIHIITQEGADFSGIESSDSALVLAFRAFPGLEIKILLIIPVVSEKPEEGCVLYTDVDQIPADPSEYRPRSLVFAVGCAACRLFLIVEEFLAEGFERKAGTDCFFSYYRPRIVYTKGNPSVFGYQESFTAEVVAQVRELQRGKSGARFVTFTDACSAFKSVIHSPVCDQ